jgi:nucleoside-diphosphate-sugar epimerase
MTVVVAGAAGFIGSAIVRAARHAGHEVIAVDLGDAYPSACDALVWAAGSKLATLPDNRAVHVDAAVRAIAACKAPRVIYLSSGECYGAAPVPFREDGPVDPRTPYAQAKLDGERAVAEHARAIVLRLGVVYGPGQAPRMLIPQVVDALRAGRHVALTEGRQTRDFVFVDDVAAAVVAALAAPDGVTEPINIASGVEVQVRELVLALGRALGASTDLLGFGELATRPDEPGRYVLDVGRAQAVLGWRATTTLAAGLERIAREAAR